MRLLLLLTAAMVASAQTRQVAITIDDLPRNSDGGPCTPKDVREVTAKLLDPIREQHIPVTAFANTGRCSWSAKDVRTNLDQWLNAGATLGNHTFSHPNFNTTPLTDFTADILKGEPILRDALAKRGQKLVYFRHPQLHTGSTPEDKRGLQDFLDAHHYTVAPVTFDNSDWEYARLYTQMEYRDRIAREYVPYMESVVAFFEERTREVLGRDIPQILLIHVHQLNADQIPNLIAMFRRRGYTFISLEQALKDPAYQLPETVVTQGGYSWIHRWSQTKKMPGKGEPEPPAWVEEAFRKLQR